MVHCDEIRVNGSASTDVNRLVSQTAQISAWCLLTLRRAIRGSRALSCLHLLLLSSSNHALAGVSCGVRPFISRIWQLILQATKGKVIDHFPMVAGKVWWAEQLCRYQEMIVHSAQWAGHTYQLLGWHEIQQRLKPINVSLTIKNIIRLHNHLIWWYQKAIEGPFLRCGWKTITKHYSTNFHKRWTNEGLGGPWSFLSSTAGVFV